MKLVLAILVTVVVAACASLSHKSEEANQTAANSSAPTRDIASLKRIARESGECINNFVRGRDKAIAAIKANPGNYPAPLVEDLDALVKGVRVACANQQVGLYGFEVYPAEKYIFLTENMRGLSNLTDGPIGRLNMKKYEIVGRLITLDHLMAGVAIHSYAEMIGLDDSQYDLFYQIMKETSQPR